MSKMEILIIDDNYEKIQSIADIFKSNGLIEIESENNSRSGLLRLKNKKYDMVIVDVIIPAILGDMPSPESGIQLIDMLISNRSYKFPSYLVAITSHRQEFDKYKGILFSKGIDLLLYDSDISQIKSFISSKMQYCQMQNLDRVSNLDGLNCPEKVTLQWLFNNVGIEIWGYLITALIFSFSLGMYSSELEFVKKIIDKPAVGEILDKENKG